jgi:hypothetical protein
MDLTQIPRPDVTLSNLPAHPRLYAGPGAFAQLKAITGNLAYHPWHAPFAASLAKYAQNALDISTFFVPGPNGHNWHLMRARHAQARLASLAVQAHITGDPKFARAAMEHVQMIHDWEYWSWITWRKNDSDPNALFDLSYGENCATLAIAHDWLQPFLTPADRALILKAARRGIDCYLLRTASLEKGKLAWWYGAAASNWNTVCSAGPGMLALTMYESIPEAPTILGRVEHSFIPYMENLKLLNGAWPEGIGYWNYGMRYAFMYLLSYETTTGLKHKYLEQGATKDSLYFPMDFCPSGVPCSFGDVNTWRPIPIHYAMATRTNAQDLLAGLIDATLPPEPDGREPMYWHNSADTLLLAPAKPVSDLHTQTSVVKLYEGQDWGIIADKLPKPNLCLAVRGGTTEVPHGHRDLTSFHLVMGKQSVITNLGVNEYLDTTFSPRRFELYDTTPMSKNVILINGVGITAPSTVITKKVAPAPGIIGLHIDATSAMGVMRDGPAAKNNQRYFLMVDSAAFLIIDFVQAAQFARFESRLHTPLSIVGDGPQFHLQKEGFTASLSLASTVKCAVYKAVALQTSPGPNPANIIRWINTQLDEKVIHAAAFIPGEKPIALSIKEDAGKAHITYQLPGKEPKTLLL